MAELMGRCPVMCSCRPRRRVGLRRVCQPWVATCNRGCRGVSSELGNSHGAFSIAVRMPFPDSPQGPLSRGENVEIWSLVGGDQGASKQVRQAIQKRFIPFEACNT
jgi:hypothetical protein